MDERPVAFVGDDEISVSWFERSYVAYLMRSGANDSRQNRYAHLENMIDAVLLSDEARARGLDQTERFKSFSERERKKSVGSRFFTEAFTATLPPPTDAELREAYTRWKSERLVRHLFFLHPDSARAAAERLAAGTSFLEEARRTYGLAEIDSSAGLLGSIRYFNVDDAFAEAAFSLEPGEISEPVRSRFGWHIIRVDNVFENPLLTEDEFQTRRGGMSSQFRLRRRRLEGDRFVRSFMESLNVQVQEDAVRALAALIDEIAYEANPDPEVLLDAETAANELAGVIEPSTVIATFELHGRQEVLTAEEYLEWLPSLPFQEAWQRTGASVGRALRNKAFALEGEKRGLYDREARRIVREAEILNLSARLREELEDSGIEPSETLIQQAMDNLNLRQIDTNLIRFGERMYTDYDDAVAAASMANKGRLSLDSKTITSGFDAPAWSTVLQTLPVGEARVVNRGRDRWAVIRIESRMPVVQNDSLERVMARDAVLPLMGTYTVLRDLRTQNEIRIDSLLFEQIMRFE